MKTNEVFLNSLHWDDDNDYSSYFLNQFPLYIQQEILRYNYVSDRNQVLASRLLLQNMLKQWGYSFEDLHYEKDKKPYLHYEGQGPFFSISRTVGRAVLVWCPNAEVGVDIERQSRVVEWQLFRSRLSDTVWEWITRSTEPTRAFIFAWTHLEALVKLQGTGIANHLKNIQFIDNQWFIKDKLVQVQTAPLPDDYLIVVAAFEPFHLQIQTSTSMKNYL